MKPTRILVAEDESIIQRVLVRILEEVGYETVAVENGWEGWRQAQNQSFDLLVTDHVMPIMGGMQLVKLVRERFPAMPVIVVSGNFIRGDTPSEYPPDARANTFEHTPGSAYRIG